MSRLLSHRMAGNPRPASRFFGKGGKIPASFAVGALCAGMKPHRLLFVILKLTISPPQMLDLFPAGGDEAAVFLDGYMAMRPVPRTWGS